MSSMQGEAINPRVCCFTQTIGFQNITQLILVNDGSTDESSSICLEYQAKYPNNIIYLYQKNAGVSTARNEGLRHTDSKYIIFLNADDYYHQAAFSTMLQFFEYNYLKIDFLAARMKFFDQRTDYNLHDYMFYKTRLVNLEKEFDCIPGYVTSGMFKAEAMRNLTFSKHLRYYEDAYFIGSLVLRKRTIGIV